MTGVSIIQFAESQVAILQGVEGVGPSGPAGADGVDGADGAPGPTYAGVAPIDVTGTNISLNIGTGLTTSGGNLVPDFGTTAGKVTQGNDSRLSDSRTPSGSAGGDLTGTYPNPTIGTGKVTSTHILDGTIVDADINASAAVSLSKLAQPAQAAVAMTAWSLYG